MYSLDNGKTIHKIQFSQKNVQVQALVSDESDPFKVFLYFLEEEHYKLVSIDFRPKLTETFPICKG